MQSFRKRYISCHNVYKRRCTSYRTSQYVYQPEWSSGNHSYGRRAEAMIIQSVALVTSPCYVRPRLQEHSHGRRLEIDQFSNELRKTVSHFRSAGAV